MLHPLQPGPSPAVADGCPVTPDYARRLTLEEPQVSSRILFSSGTGSASAGPGILLTGLTATVPRDDARLPPTGRPSPGKQLAPPADPPPLRTPRRARTGRDDRPMITNTDHKSRAQNHLPPPPGASGPKYLSSSRMVATSAAAASLISARPARQSCRGGFSGSAEAGSAGRARAVTAAGPRHRPVSRRHRRRARSGHGRSPAAGGQAERRGAAGRGPY